MLALMLVSGCSAQPGTGVPAPAFNATDVMFLQMGLEQITEGDQVVTLAAARAGDPRIRTLATELQGQWRDESGTMQRWLLGWEQPLAADPSAGTHAGHGALHALRAADIGELGAARGADFDRTAVSLLLGHLGNCVQTSRMESGGGDYPPARSLAEQMTTRRQGQIQQLLMLSAQG
ncbi:DUF305 domain-containing protein [Micromonosporaceae bacterium Da 78-11]